MKVYYNVEVLKNGITRIINKTLLTETEAEELYKDYKKSGIQYTSIEIVMVLPTLEEVNS